MNKFYLRFVFIFTFFVAFTSLSFASPRDNTPVVDETKKVYDFADLFTNNEENLLYQDIVEFIDVNDMDMAVVTIDYNNKKSAMDYADDFYDYNNFGKNSTYDGLLFLIDMDNREMWISTTGTAQLVYDDYRIDKILDSTYLEISKQAYYECANKFIERSSYYAGLGIPDSNKNAYVDNTGDYKVGRLKDNDFFATLIACWLNTLIIAVIVTVVFMIIALSQHRMVKKQTHASAYLESLNVTDRQDKFLSTHTSSVRISSDSSSSSFGGGGSSTHSSSSGRSHGGGGRSF